MLTLSPDSAARSAERSGLVGGIAEQFHSLVHWLRSRYGASGEAALVGVTSCSHGAGVSTVAANLAIAAAYRSERPVLLVDLTGKRPLLASRLSVAGDLGLERALGGAELADCVRATPIANLSLLAETDGRAFEAMCLDTSRLSLLLQALETQFGLIVVDLPPTDSGLCFATVGTLSGVLLVMEAKRTHSDAAVRAKQRLIHANAAVLGIILNKHSRDLPAWLDARL